MKIWHFPPKYLDTDTLLEELKICHSLLTDCSSKNPFPDNSPRRLFNLYREYIPFIFTRLEYLNKELSARYMGMFKMEWDGLVPEGKSIYPITVFDTERDIQTYINLVEDFEDKEDFDYVTKINMKNPQLLFEENEFILSQIRKEYEL